MSRSRKDGKGRKSSGGLSQYGLFDIPDLNQSPDDLDIDDNDVDDDLEAELNMILSSDSSKPLKPTRKAPGKPVMGKMSDPVAAASAILKDIPSDEEISDEDDPDLLAELSEITGEDVIPTHLPEPLKPTPIPKETIQSPSDARGNDTGMMSGEELVSLLTERLQLYTKAEQAALELKDSIKARRYKRGIDQLKIMLKSAESGGSINQENIPVLVVIPKRSVKPDLSPRPEITAQQSTSAETNESENPPIAVEHPAPNFDNKEVLATLNERLKQYKIAACYAKKNNDIQSAHNYIKIVKQFEVVIQGVEKGQPVDLSTMPPSPPILSSLQSSTTPKPVPTTASEEVPTILPKAEETVQTSSESTGEELTVMSSLESRLAKYSEQEESAKREGNSSKARRMGRIVKQYKDAIQLHKMGKPIPVDELPTPPGFPPIPVPGSTPAATPGPTTLPPPSSVEERLGSVTPTPDDKTSNDVSPKRSSLAPTSPGEKPSPSASPTQSQSSSRGNTQTRNERQLAMLLLRQKEYKEAALKAKQANDLVKAKEYLRLYKGFEPLIEATRQGLPVDMDTLPRAMSKKAIADDDSTFEIIRLTDCIEGSDSDIFSELITDLRNQLKMCIETMNHFKAIGDIGSANRFENLASNTKKDYNVVRSYHATNAPPPKFHYEKRSFSILRCNVDLNDNDLELQIIKGINYNVPNPREIDTYIRYEFPYPNDEVRAEKTSTVYNTNNPEYNTTFIIPIQRTSRPFQRLFKRHSLKLHLWSKGGFLRSDQLLATAQVKLQPLETRCTLHDAFDFLDGRRPMGGKIEVKLRLRNPIASKQIEQISMKWVVID